MTVSNSFLWLNIFEMQNIAECNNDVEKWNKLVRIHALVARMSWSQINTLLLSLDCSEHSLCVKMLRSSIVFMMPAMELISAEHE